MSLWELPQEAVIGGVRYPIHADFRDILEIFTYLDDPDRPEYLRWHIAVALFYEGKIPDGDFSEAVAFLADFIACGDHGGKAGPKLLDWEQDAQVIIADVNKVAGAELRAAPFVHWWTFLAYFHAIGEGQLATLVSLRDKLSRGQKLEKWEQEYYRRNKEKVVLKKRYSAEELAQRQQLNAMLDGVS